MSEKVRLPQLWGVLYAGPNENGERKMCENCQFFDDEDGDCEVLGITVTPDQICGYHVESGNYADPELAGLETVKGGTSCSRCRYFDEGTSTCEAVEGEDGGTAAVEAMGCCGRWESGE